MLAASFRLRAASYLLRVPTCSRRWQSPLVLPVKSIPLAATELTASRGRNWKLIGRTVRYLRIPFLVASVFGLGYQQGIIDDSRNPEETRGALLDNVLAGVGSSRDKMDIVHDGEAGLFSGAVSHAETRRVASIARRLIHVAKLYVKSKLQEAAKTVTAKLPSDVTNQQLLQAFRDDQECQQWTMALRRIDGDWSYLLLDTPLPNAFVTEILPQRIFITTAMFQFIDNDDELALILGHEISHLILGHLTEQNMIQTILRTVEVLLLSMDPTEGLLTLAVVGVLATLRTAVAAAHSRDHEREADELGIQLAAMACFDTKKAAKVFGKLHTHETGGELSPTKWTRFVDTHPSTADRYKDLLLASETENAEKYSTTTCQSVKNRMSMLWK